MDKISIGEIIFKLRKRKKITQEELGRYIGVSTAAVSKWESGNSYPDITFLPVLAAFFEVSIDELLNYKVELSENEAAKIFKECENLFSNGEFSTAVHKGEEYLLKYKSSYYLKLRIGFLFIMYSWKSNDEDVVNAMQIRTKKLFEDIVQNCDKEEIVEQALYQLSNIYSSMGRDDKAIETLDKIRKSELNTDVIRASIYIKKGDLKKGREIFQIELYKDIFFITSTCVALAESYVKNERNLNVAEKYYNLSTNIKKVFSLDGNSVLNLWSEYIGLAEVYLKFNKKEKATDMLYSMVEDMKLNDINKPKRFSSILYFNEITEGKGTITMNLYENILKRLEEPVFDLIREENKFKNIINELRNLKEGSDLLGQA